MEETHLIHIGAMIRKLREYRGMGTAELGFKAGNTDRFIEQVETGNIPLTVDQLVKIASALNCYLDINLTPAENQRK